MLSTKYLKIFLVLSLVLILPLAIGHGHSHGHSHGGHSHGHGGDESTKNENPTLEYLSHILTKQMNIYLQGFTKLQQAYLSALLISTASIPIFLLLVVFRLHVLKVVLNVFTAFSAGALLGEVFVHSLPEMYSEKNDEKIPRELIICFGIILFFIIDKFIGLLGYEGHSHDTTEVKSQNIAIMLLGDVLHNVTDGLAIGAAFNKNFTLGVGLTVGIFFHEIPHEVGDFSYLLKQNLGLFNVFLSQLLSAAGAFLGVYLTTLFGDTYSTHILCFSCGSFLYLSINTIMGELKHSSEDAGVFEQFCFLILEGLAVFGGIYFMTFFV